MAITSKIRPFLWFDEQAEEAARLYVSLFPNSELLSVNPLASGPGEGAALVEFDLEGMRFTALDGGPMFRLTPAVSFVVACEAQEEIDHYWYGLSDGGEQMACGWLTDRFGLSWQVAPAELGELMGRAAGPVTESLLGDGGGCSDTSIQSQLLHHHPGHSGVFDGLLRDIFGKSSSFRERK